MTTRSNRLAAIAAALLALVAAPAAGEGLDPVWEAVQSHRASLGDEGVAARRREQALQWLDDAVVELLERDLISDPGVARALPGLRQQVVDGALQPVAGRRLDKVGRFRCCRSFSLEMQVQSIIPKREYVYVTVGDPEAPGAGTDQAAANPG